MVSKTIAVGPGMFKSSLAPAAAVLYSLTALLGFSGVVLLFDRNFAQILVQQLMSSGIRSQSALDMWYVINTSVTVLSFLCPLALAVGIWTVLRGKYAQGLTFLANCSQGLLYGVYGSAAIALAVYAFRLVRYIAMVLPQNDAAYLIYSLLISEGLMGVQAWLLFRVVCKFLTCVGDSAASMGYTLSSGKLDSISTPAFTVTGLLILAGVNVALGVDRIFTVTIVQAYSGDYYSLLTAAHPGLVLAAATQLTGAVANVVLSIYLKRYNRLCERARFEANRKKPI